MPDEESQPDETKSLLGGERKVQWYLIGRKHSQRELDADRGVLVFGALASFPAALFLLWHTAVRGVEDLRFIGICVYCTGIVFMLNASLLFHRNAGSEQWTPIFLVFDKMGISFMIAGSFTPICIQCGCYTLLAIEWGLAIFSVFWELILWKRKTTWKAIVDILRFVAAGWMVLAFISHVIPYLSSWACYMALAHGIVYTLGTIFLEYKSLEFHFCIWHSLVLLAAAMLYSVVYTQLSVGPPLGPALAEPLDEWLRKRG